MKSINKYSFVAILLAGILLAAGPCAAQDDKVDVRSSKTSIELQKIDGISTQGVVIGDVLYTLGEDVQYFDDDGEPTDLLYFKVGDLVFFSVNDKGEINGMWKEQKS